MATLVLTSLATSIAGSFGFSAFATAALSAGVGLIGNFIDQRLFGTTQNIQQEGPRLDEVRFTGSSEGTPIARVAGRVRIPGNIIWTTKYREEIETTTTSTGGGKGGGGGGSSVTTTEYKYYVSFALAVCEGPIQQFGRIWADGAVMDLADKDVEFYYGTDTQTPETSIINVEGADNVSAYRGIAYIVFRDLLLSDGYANRIPQLNVEVYRSTTEALAEFEDKIKAITIIPSSGEFAYGTTEVLTHNTTTDVSTTQNNHSNTEDTDWTASMDQLERLAPNMHNPSLVVAWHGTDLRVGSCQIEPRVETEPSVEKNSQPYVWEVSGLTRGNAVSVSQEDVNGDGSEYRPYVGGVVSDRAVKEAIEDMNSRGMDVTFYPFILMDIPPGNTLPNPDIYGGGTGQAAFPWRGRITLASSSDDQTAAAATQVGNFFGTCQPVHFNGWDGNTIPYIGPAEWSFRRMILHYAWLCVAAGGVDTFIIGTEMVKLNHIRDNTGAHPAVDEFIDLADDVRAILGSGTNIVYAADWSEFPNYRPDDGSNDVIFHLDPLWSHGNIDAVGIDNYMPLSDWRDSTDHLDAQNYDSIYDLAYLKSQVAGGEGFDYYYASESDRFTQTRTTIEDTAHGEDWIFAYKDLVNWWQNNHHNRPGGVRNTSATSWVPESKPIWFTEVGCPAIDKGTNQPNVFLDPKSSESFAPYFSSAVRDDFIQRQYNIALIEYWNDNANNPASGSYSGRMVDTDRMYIWTWDARPFPEFPYRGDIWSDGDNWETGHWLNGRIGTMPLRQYVEELTDPFSLTIDASELYGMITGYTISDTLSVREILQPLMKAYFFDAFESEGILKFRHRGISPILSLTQDDLVITSNTSKHGGPFTLTRGQLTETPQEVRIKFIHDDYDYTSSALSARRKIGNGSGVSDNSFNLTMNSAAAQSVVDTLLIEAHVTRERVETNLPPSLLYLDASDVISLNVNNRDFDFRLEELGYEYHRPTTGMRTEASTYKRSPGPSLTRKSAAGVIVGLSTTTFMDLPMLRDSDVPHAPWFASSASPWPGAIAIHRSSTGTSFTQDNSVGTPSIQGSLTADLDAGPANLWDWGNSIEVAVNTSTSIPDADPFEVLAGANAAAVYNEAADLWEIIQWQQADAIGTNLWRLSGLLRGQNGTEAAMGIPTGARFVIIDTPLVQSNIGNGLLNLNLEWQYGPAADVIGSDTYTTVNFTPKGIGLRPYSPCSVVAAKSAASNDITLGWKRRTRIGGETWDNSDVPLSEDFERYEIDIYNGAGTTVLRTITVNDATSYVYSSANQTTDFGSSPTTLDFEVFQISGQFGRGTGRREQISFLF